MLKGKKILLGVTGSIAAYKAALLIRLFRKEGAEVQVVMTPSGRDFITPVTLSALSGPAGTERVFPDDRRYVEQPCRTRSVGGCDARGSCYCCHVGKDGLRHSGQFADHVLSLV